MKTPRFPFLPCRAVDATVLWLAVASCLFAPAALAESLVADRRAEAIALFHDDRRAAAKVLFEQLVARNPKDADALYYLAALTAMGGDWEKAVPLAERSVAAEPGNARFHYGLGQACGLAALRSGLLSRYGYARRSRAAYEKAVELDPQSLRFREALINYYAVAPSVAGGGMDKAHAQAQALKAIDPVAGRICLADVFTREKRFSEAFAELEAALVLAPDNYLTLFRLGRLAGASGQRVDEGIAWLDRCLQMPPPAEEPRHQQVHVRRGNLLHKKGDPTGARAAYEAALKLVPDYGPAKAALAKLDAANEPKE